MSVAILEAKKIMSPSRAQFLSDHIIPGHINYDSLDHPIFPMVLYDVSSERAEYIKENLHTTPKIKYYSDIIESYPDILFFFPQKGHIPLRRELTALKQNRNRLGNRIYLIPHQPGFGNEFYSVADKFAYLSDHEGTFGTCGQAAVYSAVVDINPALARAVSYSPVSQKLEFDSGEGNDTPIDRYLEKLEAEEILTEELISVTNQDELSAKIESLQPNQRLLVSIVFDFPGYGRYTHWWALAGIIQSKSGGKLPVLFSEYTIKEIMNQYGSVPNGSDIYALLIGDGTPIGIDSTPFFAVPWSFLQRQVLKVLRTKSIVESSTLSTRLQADKHREGEYFTKNCVIVTVHAK